MAQQPTAMPVMGWGQPSHLGAPAQMVPIGLGMVGGQPPHPGVGQDPLRTYGNQLFPIQASSQPTLHQNSSPGLAGAITATSTSQETNGPAAHHHFIEQLSNRRETLLKQAKAPSTLATYAQVNQHIQAFEKRSGLSVFPSDAIVTSLFVTYLAEFLAPSTIRTMLSALAYKYQFTNWLDPTKHFLVLETLRGHHRRNGTEDTRLPITLNLLSQLYHMSAQVFCHPYDACLYQTIMLVAFYGLMRISELVLTPAKHALQIFDVMLYSDRATLTLRSYKHSKPHVEAKITLWRQQYLLCPVRQLELYLLKRPQLSTGQLFVTARGFPVTRHQFTCALRQLFTAIQLNDTRYKSHSFRIGGATLAASLGLPSDLIRQLGRWKSNAFMKYIRY
ncbi:uncharacterized protein LOC106160349 [Lingula anatina]|uniref:Uncharacterized protein LOC106160349 n=1 Tax=Lingula anatina TaxID=7574 RepID=A0A1S3I286_LINAN|nr:uncharacterized protein LOC106160349 [Lingula anatina]|eukprot:XP_013392382.1 uncharacterized protein LOC106160349 [Lingula anatina]